MTHLHADHFLDLVPFSYALTYAPRQQPVPVDPLAGHRPTPRAPPARPAGRERVFRRIVGAWGNDDLIENAFALREYDPARRSRSARCGSASSRSLTSRRPSPIEIKSSTGGGASPSAPTTPRARCSWSSRGARAADDRGHPPARGARGRARPPDPRRRPASAPPRGTRRVVLTHISDELGADGRGARRRRPSGRRWGSPARAPPSSFSGS